MNRLLSRPAAVVTVLVGVGLVVLAGGRPWVSQALTGVPGVARATASGNQAAPAVTAVALAAAAGAVALALTGRIARRIVALLLVVAGLGVVGLTVAILQNPGQAVLPAVQNATGRVGSLPSGPAAEPIAWAWSAVVGGVLVLLGGLAALLGSGRWGTAGRRFETSTGSAAESPASRPPAAGEAGKAAGAGQTAEPDAASVRSASASPRSAAGRTCRDQDLDTWDALSRGEDPTAG